MPPIALLSVSNKEGLLPLAKKLHHQYGFELISSGGTAKALEEGGLEVKRVADHTGEPEILGGRVKTLHPKIHGGILAKREDQAHESDLKKNKILAIDLVVVNLYPFKETVADKNVSWDKAIENIDIGGPAMVRAAAKNHKDVAVLTSPDQYEIFLDALEKGKGETTRDLRCKLALEAFELTAAYDVAISKWISQKLNNEDSPRLEVLPLKQTLRYGENPHQNAAWYSNKYQGWGAAKQLQGKELSTNNLLDLDAALSTVREFGYDKTGANPAREPAAVVVKHTNPCGVGISDSLQEALKKALQADPISAFGGIVALNQKVDKQTAEELTQLFIECALAPEFSIEAQEVLSKKKNLRLLEINSNAIDSSEKDQLRSILGGAIIQEQDIQKVDQNEWGIVTKTLPSEKQKEDMYFAWRVVRHIRSNAILVASSGQTLGVGAGQMNRVGAAKLAIEAAGEEVKGAVLASDGFFPFDDTVRLAAKYGISAIIQPGGSIRDEDSIAACNEHGITMIFTGRRHFLH